MTGFVTADGVCKVIHTRDDGRGGNIRVALWNQPGNDVTGMVARSQKIAGTFEKVTQQQSEKCYGNYIEAQCLHIYYSPVLHEYRCSY